MSKSFANELNGSGFNLPGELSSRFIIGECLTENENGVTFLLLEMESQRRYILKGCPKHISSKGISEVKLLSGLQHKSLPRFEMEFDDGDFSFTLREYIDGIPLGHYVDERGELDALLATNITMDLCDVLSYLHSRPAPIIHRDIKPSNIIIDPISQNIKLIDFGIARVYSDTTETDTVYYGTRKFSPPEQYGYAQTDHRADIFAVGVVLRFMVTGAIDGSTKDKMLSRIIKKCTAFDPKNRYQSAAALKRALLNYKHHIMRKIAVAAASVAVLFLTFALGFFIGKYAESNKAYSFTEPMIEQAVRAALGYNSQRVILEEDLKDVETLVVMGTEVFAATSDTFYDMNLHSWWIPNDSREHGDIQQLNDISKMINLKNLALIGQQITDLAPLTGLPIEIMILDGNPLVDITPLRYCPDLRELSINDTHVYDVSTIRSLWDLETLKAAYTQLYTLSQLSSTGIAYLFVCCVPANDFESLSTMPNLIWLGASPVTSEELAVICSIDSIAFLNFFNTNIIDYEPLKQLSNLSEIEIHGIFNETADFSVLSEIGNLKKVIANSRPAELIREANPDSLFEIIIKG